MEVTAIFEQDEGWWIAWTEELRGPVGQGRTLDECRESLMEAIELTLEFMHEEAERQIEGRPVVRERIRVAP